MAAMLNKIANGVLLFFAAFTALGCFGPRYMVARTPEGMACVRECQQTRYLCMASQPGNTWAAAACSADENNCRSTCPGAYDPAAVAAKPSKTQCRTNYECLNGFACVIDDGKEAGVCERDPASSVASSDGRKMPTHPARLGGCTRDTECDPGFTCWDTTYGGMCGKGKQ
jgi:hypothetical protein